MAASLTLLLWPMPSHATPPSVAEDARPDKSTAGRSNNGETDELELWYVPDSRELRMPVYFSGQNLPTGSVVAIRSQRCAPPCILSLTPGVVAVAYGGGSGIRGQLDLRAGGPTTAVVRREKAGSITALSWVGLVVGGLATLVGGASMSEGSDENRQAGTLLFLGGAGLTAASLFGLLSPGSPRVELVRSAPPR